jgi:lipid-A-disaccharide synthase-like uncharacterized protein
MNDALLTFPFFGWTVVVTAWKIIGLGGGFCFLGRWVVQAIHRHLTKRKDVPGVFWWMSLLGSSATLSYFIFGKNDVVGILTNSGPMLIAGYNLWLNAKEARQARTADGG